MRGEVAIDRKCLGLFCVGQTASVAVQDPDIVQSPGDVRTVGARIARSKVRDRSRAPHCRPSPPRSDGRYHCRGCQDCSASWRHPGGRCASRAQQGRAGSQVPLCTPSPPWPDGRFRHTGRRDCLVSWRRTAGTGPVACGQIAVDRERRAGSLLSLGWTAGFAIQGTEIV